MLALLAGDGYDSGQSSREVFVAGGQVGFLLAARMKWLLLPDRVNWEHKLVTKLKGVTIAPQRGFWVLETNRWRLDAWCVVRVSTLFGRRFGQDG